MLPEIVDTECREVQTNPQLTLIVNALSIYICSTMEIVWIEASGVSALPPSRIAYPPPLGIVLSSSASSNETPFPICVCSPLGFPCLLLPATLGTCLPHACILACCKACQAACVVACCWCWTLAADTVFRSAFNYSLSSLVIT